MTDLATAPVAAALPGHNIEKFKIEEIARELEAAQKQIPDHLRVKYPDLERRRLQLLETFKTLPQRCDDEATAQKLSDHKMGAMGWITEAKALRTSEKKPWAKIGDIFYAFFTNPIESIQQTVEERITPILKDYQDRKAEAATQKALEEQRKAEAEAARKRQEAEAAEARRAEAERAERAAKEAAAAAAKKREDEAREADAAKARAAEAERQRRAAEADRIAAQARAREAAEAASRDAARAEEARAAQAEAERQQAEAEAKRKIAEEEKAKAEAETKAARERATAARAEQKTAEDAAVAARVDQRVAVKTGREADQAAGRADRIADRQESLALAPAAAKGRIRGEYGSVSSVRTDWFFKPGWNRAELDLEALRQHLPAGAIETAIRAWLDANKEALDKGHATLRGVEVYADTVQTTR